MTSATLLYIVLKTISHNIQYFIEYSISLNTVE